MLGQMTLAGILGIAAAVVAAAAQEDALQRDTIATSGGDLVITFVGHGSLVFEHGGKVVHVDPFGRLTDYGALPKADLILVTHHHGDHLDPEAIAKLRTERTELVLTAECARTVEGGKVMANGARLTVSGFDIEAVPAYNQVHKRDNGEPFHPRGEGNGYVISFGDKRVYVAGDTENVPEMEALAGIDIAFLPMNLPYTMTPAMVAEAARAFQPKLLYPYHTGATDVSELVDLLKDADGIELRVRPMQ
jgi:L-ascorbate metabolism protein UlaG (beta-lactamase superfamily)